MVLAITDRARAVSPYFGKNPQAWRWRAGHAGARNTAPIRTNSAARAESQRGHAPSGKQKMNGIEQ
jgi:hypothetical protein